jgi:hypothetical protein
LLKPKYGGAAFVLGSMCEQMHTMLEITIYYPDGTPEFWDLLCERVKNILVDVRNVNVPVTLRGKDYPQDEALKIEFKNWIHSVWQEKDALIE